MDVGNVTAGGSIRRRASFRLSLTPARDKQRLAAAQRERHLSSGSSGSHASHGAGGSNFDTMSLAEGDGDDGLAGAAGADPEVCVLLRNLDPSLSASTGGSSFRRATAGGGSHGAKAIAVTLASARDKAHVVSLVAQLARDRQARLTGAAGPAGRGSDAGHAVGGGCGGGAAGTAVGAPSAATTVAAASLAVSDVSCLTMSFV